MTRGQANTYKHLRFFSRTQLLLWASAFCLTVCAAAQESNHASAAPTASLTVTPGASSEPAASTAPQAIVIGFLGGYVSGNSPIRSEVKMSQRLRAAYPQNVHVQTFANRDINKAYSEILKFIGANHDGKVSDDDKQKALVIVYGHSWGGTATVALARKLQKDGIPVRLTVQVDSVQHWSVNDSIIPANVAKAANFYQTGGMLNGRPKITAADPSRTQILGNYRFDYEKNPVQCEGYPFWDRWFSKTHMEIECDPKVWSEVESLIRAELPKSSAPTETN